MRKDIYVVTVTTPDGKTSLSDEGYENIFSAMYFIETRTDNPVKQPYSLTWKSEELTYEIHLIKVGN